MRDWIERWSRVWDRGAFPAEFWWLLDFPGRGLVENAGRHAERLEVARDGRVLEIGSGGGFWSGAAARCVPEGRLHLFDLQPAFLTRARRRMAKEGCANVTYCAGDAQHLAYRDGVFDAAYFVTVLGEVPSPEACLAEVFRVLKSGGRMAVTERRGDPDFVSQARLVAMAETTGFRLKQVYGRSWAYTAMFLKG